MNEYLSAARDLVVDGMRESEIALSHELEYHLAVTVAHYMRKNISADRLTIRLVEVGRRGGPRDEARQIGDECLIGCAFFARRLTRLGGTTVHYAALGQVAYEAAGLEEAAGGFPDMLDVLQASGAAINDSSKPDLPIIIGRKGKGSSPQFLDISEARLIQRRREI
ncbi:hypothetical protein [Paracoccus sp. MKU1]|uniref:hypothetical protein n=1 Tax=Paracoccus sp. MKU1 TaxID=1745182 RepID=UPI0009EB36B4|nr:hypothetical protein [Paracoccus sp. MKU1]